MPRILLLATTTGYQTRAFGDAAARLGADLVFATDRCHMLEDPWQDAAVIGRDVQDDEDRRRKVFREVPEDRTQRFHASRGRAHDDDVA